ncbi:hypothetical protein DCO58_11200 [Helicobacter saguini]|uniref:Periplasmic protein n=1 Tax=Helicobacter saguini TaxID=1548018 RepID=A0A347VQ01_9HELI|nr:hypothetical protein [Helicobacter saguini]MWV61138.1 hypothetical protein [Helicobacter saguini]MWV68193.1 hypothetical protein [Helicobacter saguini]MWV70343.1 hypothetical protein [Helicobacter saguini]MWV72245.1 hypothetical protein [Helicobacter saguini]TLD95291.1 hypothetical protein LS64_002775 [Helicobacter saguini]
MIKGIIAGLLFISTIIGGYVLYAFYKKMQNSDVEIEQTIIDNAPKPRIAEIPKLDSIPDNTWISGTPKAKDTSYQFPSNVLDINVDVKKYEDLKTDYTKVLVKNLDDYKFLCINEILRQRRIDFSYFKNQNSLDLLLFVPNKEQREAILKDFDYYNVEYEISLKR